jgi:parallel beta-helix repeat protein
LIESDNVTFKGVTVCECLNGIGIDGSNCSFSDNTVAENHDEGLVLYGGGCTVANNSVLDNGGDGISWDGQREKIVSNFVENNSGIGIWIISSSMNIVESNEVINNSLSGIVDLAGDESSPDHNNVISLNDISNNGWGGSLFTSGIFLLGYCQDNVIVANSVSNNKIGLFQEGSAGPYAPWITTNRDNHIYHNSFVNNSVQVVDDPGYPCENTWDNGYPSGGNYWSDYNGTDVFSGPYQNITGSDGIGDTPYVIDASNIDHYPLMYPYVPQYYLTVVSPYDTAGGTGWYDWGTTAYATLATGTVDIVPGWVEAVFTGWSGDATGTGLTSDPIFVNGPKTVVADWKIQYYLQVATNPSSLPPVPGADWYDNWTYVNLTAPQYDPNETGVSGVRGSFSYWDVDGVSQGAGVNSISVQMNTYHVATAYYTLQYLVVFNQTGVGSDFPGTVLAIDGSNYNVTGLPASFWYDNGTTHSFDFAFQSPLPVGSGAKLYYWTSASGLSTSESGSIVVSGPGSIVGNYVTMVHDVAVESVVATVPHCASKVGKSLWVFQGRPVYVNVTVLNNGDFNETVNVTLYYNMTANEAVGTQSVTILTGENGTVSFVWDTTGVPYNQNYTLTAVATISPADYTPADNTLSAGPITVRIMGDINGDGVVDGSDIALAAAAFGSYGPGYLYPGSPPSARWNLDCDINGDGVVDGQDLVLIARNFGM